MYSYHTPSGDKSCDGMAMALRAGLPLRDMEMVQFHPTGLLAGRRHAHDRHGARRGLARFGRLAARRRPGERFMLAYDPRGERATRDIVSRAIMDRIRNGRASPNGGVCIAMGHLGPENVRREFKGMVERCADCGFDLAGGRVEVIPTAHYMMGGVVFAAGLHDADAAAVMRRARTPAACTAPTGSAATASPTPPCSAGSPAMRWRQTTKPSGALARSRSGGARSGAQRALRRRSASRRGDLNALRKTLLRRDVGRCRHHRAAREGLARGRDGARDARARDRRHAACAGADRRYNLTWMDRLNLENLILVSQAIAPPR